MQLVVKQLAHDLLLLWVDISQPVLLLLQFNRGIDLQELLELHKPASHANDDLPLFDTDEDSLGAKGVDLAVLPYERDH
jgi:hypothetical protein